MSHSALIPKGLRKPLLLLWLLSICSAPISSSADQLSDLTNARQPTNQLGAKIFSDACASCHGEQGEGVAGAYERPLTSDSSIGELASLISEAMPEDDPEACVGEEAFAVARFIYDEFRHPNAQGRRNPPRIRLARLTASQLRQSLADLYGRFGERIGYTDLKGLQARYRDRKSKDEKVEFERVDNVIDFDFGHDGPGYGVNAEDYAIEWKSALQVDVTGRYELIVRSSCAFVFYFGDYEREFVNNYVQSGNRTEFRKSIYLTTGNVYPVSIDFYQRKRKTEQPPARISLSWKTPYGEEQIIPARAFVNVVAAPSTFALQAKLPPDDRSYGYERGIAVDRQWDESTTEAAIEFADQVIAELWPRYRDKVGHDSSENRGTLRRFLLELVTTAFRGSIDDELRNLYIEDQVTATEDDSEAIKRVLLISLKSPRFLYPLLHLDRSKSQRVANRLALTLHDSLPSDEWLREDAKNNRLEHEDQVRDAAWKMVTDWRTRGKTRQLMYEWLNLSHVGVASKDEAVFPGFNAELVSELRDSFDAFLDDVVWTEASDFRQLLIGDWAYTSPSIEGFYGERWKPAPPGNRLRRTAPDKARRFGVLTHPYLMSGLAYRDSTSPIHRGVFLYRYVLGRTLRPPNEAFTPLSPELHPDLTTRERTALQTSPANCQVCHARINGLGFVLENFDAVGRYQLMDNGRAIDASGRYTNTRGGQQELAGPGELASFLAGSQDVHRAFVNRAFQYFVKQPPAAFGLETEDRLLKSFVENDFNIRKLLVAIAVTAATATDKNTDSVPQ